MSLPALDIFAYASRGNGAFVNDKRIKVSDTEKLSNAYMVFNNINKAHLEDYEERFLNLINICGYNRGYGDALGQLLVARGFVDISFEKNQPWDVAPGKIIVEEAGGKVTDFEGKDTIYSGWNVLTNSKLHDAVLEILKK